MSDWQRIEAKVLELDTIAALKRARAEALAKASDEELQRLRTEKAEAELAKHIVDALERPTTALTTNVRIVADVSDATFRRIATNASLVKYITFHVDCAKCGGTNDTAIADGRRQHSSCKTCGVCDPWHSHCTYGMSS